jgi:Na+-translocating ferredoxin:NAD+ oxidoreductase RnfC subunit
MRHLWETPGGVHPPDNKAQSQTMSIGQVPLPKTLILPLNSAFDEVAKASVRIGDRVLKGQKIADIPMARTDGLNLKHIPIINILIPPNYVTLLHKRE